MNKINLLVFTILMLGISSNALAQKKGNKKNKTEIDKVKTSTTPVETIPAIPENLVWYDDVFKADSISKKTSKPIFAFFTGSDWCGWCHKLQREVFAKPEFKKWASKKVVLLELDYPRRKALAPNLQQQNAGMQQAFKVQGFPTIWMFYITTDSEKNDIKINPLGSLGYPSNAIAGKEEIAFLETANDILAKDKK